MTDMQVPAISSAPESHQPFRRISVGSLALYGGFVVRKASALILAAIMTRFIGLAGFGLYCLVLVLMEFAARLSVFGSDVLIVKAISTQNPDGERYAANALAWRGLASVSLCLVLVGGVAWLKGPSPVSYAAAIMGLGMIAQVCGDTYLSVIQGLERVHLAGYVQMFCHTVGLILAVAAVWCGMGLVGVAVAYTLRAVVLLIGGALLCRILKHPVGMSFNPRVIGLMLRRGAPIAGGRVLTVVYLGSGIVAMEHFHGAEAAGIFGGAMKIFEGCAALGMLTAVSAFPTLSRLRTECTDSLRRVVNLLIRIITWIGVPLCVLLGLNAERLLMLLFGEAFAGQGTVLVILAAAIPFSFGYVLIERLAYAADDQKRVMLIRAVGTTMSILLLLAAARSLGPVGAALAYLGAEMSMLSLLLPRLPTYSPGVLFARTALPGGIASVVALTIALSVSLPGWLSSVAFLGVFGSLYLVCWGLPRLGAIRCVKTGTRE